RWNFHSLESHQRVNWTTLLRSLEVSFNNLISRHASAIGDRHSRTDRIAGLQRRCRELHRPVLERGVAQSISETPKWLTAEVAIGSVLERVVRKLRQSLKRRVESHR